MKKFLKFTLGVLGVCAGVAGGLYVYNKFKAKKNETDDDFEEDFDYDDDFADDEDETPCDEVEPEAPEADEE